MHCKICSPHKPLIPNNRPEEYIVQQRGGGGSFHVKVNLAFSTRSHANLYKRYRTEVLPYRSDVPSSRDVRLAQFSAKFSLERAVDRTHGLIRITSHDSREKKKKKNILWDNLQLVQETNQSEVSGSTAAGWKKHFVQ